MERIPEAFRPVQESIEDKKDVLSAAKEALVAVTNRFTLDILMMAKAAERVQSAVYSFTYDAKQQSISDLKEVVVHVFEEVLSEKGMHVPDIMHAFESALDEHLPGQEAAV